MAEAPAPTVSLEDAWQALLAAALLGTGRQSPAAPGLPAALEALLEQSAPDQPGESDEARLLHRAAVLSLYRQAGALPKRTAAPLPAPCPPDTQPCGSPALNQMLERLLEEPRLPLWIEILQTMEKAGLRLRETLLPRLLDEGARRPELVEALLPVLGERGRWLAAQVPSWGYARWRTPEDIWLNGENRPRRRLLRQQRQADPAQARRMLSDVWNQEDAETRCALLETFEVNLSPEDEPFLEQALADRSLGVRRLAADLLARLPNSGLVQRMTARVQKLAHLDPGRWPLRKPRLEIELPESCTPEMVRDGVLPAPPKTWQGGEKAFWLGQMLQMVPPSWWCQAWGKTPTELLDLAESSEWKELLHESWITAACRTRDMAWVQALYKRYPLRDAIMTALPPELCEALARDQLHSRNSPGAVALLMNHPGPWSLDFSRLVFEHLHRDLIAQPYRGSSWQLRQQMLVLAYRLHPGLARYAVPALTQANSVGLGWEKFAEEFLYILTVRNQILEEITHD